MLKKALLSVPVCCFLFSVCVCCFSFMYLCVCLTCCLFTQPSMPRPAFGTSLGLVKVAHFPFCPYSLFLPSSFHISHISTSSSTITSTIITSSFDGRTPAPFKPSHIRNKLTNLHLSKTHTKAQSITNPTLTLPQNEHCVKAAGIE